MKERKKKKKEGSKEGRQKEKRRTKWEQAIVNIKASRTLYTEHHRASCPWPRPRWLQYLLLRAAYVRDSLSLSLKHSLNVFLPLYLLILHHKLLPEPLKTLPFSFRVNTGSPVMLARAPSLNLLHSLWCSLKSRRSISNVHKIFIMQQPHLERYTCIKHNHTWTSVNSPPNGIQTLPTPVCLPFLP